MGLRLQKFGVALANLRTLPWNWTPKSYWKFPPTARWKVKEQESQKPLEEREGSEFSGEEWDTTQENLVTSAADVRDASLLMILYLNTWKTFIGYVEAWLACNLYVLNKFSEHLRKKRRCPFGLAKEYCIVLEKSIILFPGQLLWTLSFQVTKERILPSSFNSKVHLPGRIFATRWPDSPETTSKWLFLHSCFRLAMGVTNIETNAEGQVSVLSL